MMCPECGSSRVTSAPGTLPVCRDCDWTGWQKLTERLGSGLQVVGDDLLVTNPERVSRAIEEGSANAVSRDRRGC